MKLIILILCFLFSAHLQFPQNIVSIEYEKPNIKNLNSLGINYLHTVYENIYLSSRVGGKLNYLFGNYSVDNELLGKKYYPSYKIYQIEIIGEIAYTQFVIKPFFNIGLGIEHFKKDMNYPPDMTFIYVPLPLDDYSAYLKLGFGISYLASRWLMVSCSYNSYFFQYAKPLLPDIPEQEINNQRECFGISLSYIF